ncbi:MAG TPA: hypothetical protein VJZ70_00065 [Limnochordia bacterium]|nr:hypothetical protein [Limnochordia bacterium]
MYNQSHFLGKFAILTLTALSTLTLFDSNSWWRVLLLAIPLTLANLFLTGLSVQQSWPRPLSAPLQGVLAAFLSYLVSLTGLLRVTFGTLVGFALLLTLLEYLLAKFYPTSE